MSCSDVALQTDVVIRVSNLNKNYHIYGHPSDRFKEFIFPKIGRFFKRPVKSYSKKYAALKNVSFEIRQGETVGIIGRNGAGKSTLLQIICNTLSPTSGTVETAGRIAALLELGSGFNTEYTGRENVFLNAIVLGLSQDEVARRFDSIVEFSEIGDYIDQPVKTYSSGMFVRLAFAVIAHVDADVLIIDEALSVGDVYFQQKCMRFIRGFKKRGGTLLFVSHDTATVLSICDQALLLSPGGTAPALKGSAKDICEVYLSQLYAEPSRREHVETYKKSLTTQSPSSFPGYQIFTGRHQKLNLFNISAFRSDAQAFGERGGEIITAGFFTVDGKERTSVLGGENVVFRMRALVHRPIHFPAFGIMLKDRQGQFLFTDGTDRVFRSENLLFQPGDLIEACFSFQMPILITGKYSLNVALAEGIGDDHIQHHWIHDAVILESLEGPLVHGIAGLADMLMTVVINPEVAESA